MNLFGATWFELPTTGVLEITIFRNRQVSETWMAISQKKRILDFFLNLHIDPELVRDYDGGGSL